MLSKFKQTDVTCLCNISNPTRRHLTWQCESFAAKRLLFIYTERDMPCANTAAAGLLILSRSITWEFEPCRLLQNGLQLFRPPVQENLFRLLKMLSNNLPQSNLCVLAIDGGSFRCNLGTRCSWGIANCNHASGGKLQGLDQSSYASEITALLILLLLLSKEFTSCHMTSQV